MKGYNPRKFKLRPHKLEPKRSWTKLLEPLRVPAQGYLRSWYTGTLWGALHLPGLASFSASTNPRLSTSLELAKTHHPRLRYPQQPCTLPQGPLG